MAYPYGLWDERVAEAARAAGYRLAWAWLPGPWDPLAAPRLPAPPRHGAGRLALKLLGIRGPTRCPSSSCGRRLARKLHEMAGTVVIDCFPESALRYRDGWAVVAIDVIRATTTATTAVALGRRCFPVPSLEAAVPLAAQLDRPLLVGELGGTCPTAST